jgi:hypothetical protein
MTRAKQQSLAEPLCGTAAVQILHTSLHCHLFTGPGHQQGMLPGRRLLIASFSRISPTLTATVKPHLPAPNLPQMLWNGLHGLKKCGENYI